MIERKKQFIKQLISEFLIKFVQSYKNTYAIPIYEVVRDFYGEEKVELKMEEIPIEKIEDTLYKLTPNNFCNRLINYNYNYIDNYLEELINKLPKNITIECLDDENYSLFADTVKEIIENYNQITVNIVPQNIEICFEIWIHFPEITVTNEAKQSTTIYDMFTKIKFGDKARYSNIYFCKTTYTPRQYARSYSHSHLPGINKRKPYMFLHPCIGEGPFRNAIVALNRSATSMENRKLQMMSLCFELQRFLETESLEGGPYIRLQSLNDSNNINRYRLEITDPYYLIYNSSDIIPEFIKHLVKSKFFKFNFKSNLYNIQGDYHDLLFQISNEFIRWYNNLLDGEIQSKFTIEELFNMSILNKAIRVGNTIYRRSSEEHCEEVGDIDHENAPVFKGKEYRINIIEDKKEEENPIIILNYNIVNKIIVSITRIINFEYEDSKYKEYPAKIGKVKREL